ncbi:HEAT repeat domain-containing protein [Planomonospora sp. ID67723]|uniref:HEAT repeat domain-containing protein n=1 Tax=Planomonospora sp. ID67723 TaxID=2738134 RepID=UPI001A2EBFF6|nr:HEAT repeat domain-containing protein [Planomonospora sp. ID67723]MBG0829733.1 HEAT repeat domain-containing protein [Planomonospora sp. ID67723]
MTDSDVLAGLDEVPWADLDHAYGPADDVPGLLRALRSERADERERALPELYSNIFHQGNRYPATAPAVPFLAQLALDPATPERNGIVYLLVAVAIAYDESQLPGGVDIAGWRAELGRMRSADPAAELRKFDMWVDAARDEGESRGRSVHRAVDDYGRVLRSAQAELDAYDAVRAEVPALRGLLDDDDPLVRAATAYLLGWFPEEAAGSITALEALLERESVTGVIADAIISAGLLSATELTPRLRDHLSGSEPVSRWAAATALVRLGVVEPEVIGVLAAASVDPPTTDTNAEISFMSGDVRGYSAQTLAALSGRLPVEIIDAVLEGLSRTSQVAAFPVAAAALRLVFPDGAPCPLPPFAELTGLQRRAVRILAELGPETWRWLNFTSILEAWNLPDTHVECRAYAGLDTSEQPPPSTFQQLG